MDDTHECPKRGCTHRVLAHMLTCRGHWYAIPKPLRDAVWDTWDHGAGDGHPSHTAAITAAVEALNRPETTP